MGAHQTAVRSWGSVLSLLIGAIVSMGIVARAANAEGVIHGQSFVVGGSKPAASLIDALGDSQLQAPLAAAVSQPASRVAARPASLRERTTTVEVDGDLFPHSRLALPLVMQLSVGDPAEAALAASEIRPMTGQMVGFKPHPRTWGSTLDR